MRCINLSKIGQTGALRESNSRPLAPKARIIPLDQTPIDDNVIMILFNIYVFIHHFTLNSFLRINFKRAPFLRSTFIAYIDRDLYKSYFTLQLDEQPIIHLGYVRFSFG